jgi:hypothetical protein
MSLANDYGYQPAGKYIINHDVMGCTADGVVANHLFSGRALGISEPWDIIQLHPDLQPLWPAIRDHYRRIGLSHSENVIWNLGPESAGGTHRLPAIGILFWSPGMCRLG